jgi:hypothetical protein
MITAVGSLVIAYLYKKTRELEKDKKDLGVKVDALHNGFRQEVHTKICKLEEQVEALGTDMALIKGMLVRSSDKEKK